MKKNLGLEIKKDLRQVADKDKAKILARFFKTGRGEYGEGDKFLGVTVPKQRVIAKKYVNLKLTEIRKLCRSSWHEERLTAVLILVEQYEQARRSRDEKLKKEIFDFYLKNLNGINNWDLVDLSAPKIVGDFLFYLKASQSFKNNFLLNLAKSKNLWSRRVAVLATFNFIKQNKFEEILRLTEFLIFTQKESHDLMHKALGWMWREVGKRDKKTLVNFLNKFAPRLPRITLRYAIEKFKIGERAHYLKLKS